MKLEEPFSKAQLAVLEQIIRHPDDYPTPPEYRVILQAILEKYPDTSLRDLVWQHIWMSLDQYEKLDEAVRDSLDVLTGWCNPAITKDWERVITHLTNAL